MVVMVVMVVIGFRFQQVIACHLDVTITTMGVFLAAVKRSVSKAKMAENEYRFFLLM